MGVFEHFPYTNFHDLNLDWIVQELEKLTADVRDFISINAIKYANPIQWDITNQYEKNTVVLDKDGNAYLSVQPVPAGVSLDRTDYWTNIGNFSALWESVKEAITIPDEGYEKTASVPRAVNDLVWVDGNLIEVTSPMLAGDQYTIGSNCRLYTMQIFLTETLAALKQEQQAREQADDDLKNAIDKTAINSFFKGKKILILGDSNSIENEDWRGETWVTPFREYLSGIAETIDNNSTSGRHFTSGGEVPSMVEIVDTLDPSKNYDYIILFCGVNDWSAQREIGSVNTYENFDNRKFADAVTNTVEKLINKYPAAGLFFITPMNTADYATVTTPLLVYANCIRAVCGHRYGTPIDGYLAPCYSVNGTSPTVYSMDGLHYKSAYSPIFARFVINSMISGGTATAKTSKSMNIEPSDVVKDVNCTVSVFSDGHTEVHFKGKLARTEYKGFFQEPLSKWIWKEWFTSIAWAKVKNSSTTEIQEVFFGDGNVYPTDGFFNVDDEYEFFFTMWPESMNKTYY